MIKFFQKNKKYSKLISAIQKAETVLLFTHINPDGDALGALLSMRMAVQHFHKKVYAVILDTVKHDLDFLPGVDQLLQLADFPKNFNFKNSLAISLDVADKKRLGAAHSLFVKAENTAQLDHHPTNDAFADLNYIETSACSTAIMVYDFIKENKIPISVDLATTLYTGISTDTGNFAFSNTNVHTFEAMTDLAKAGLPINELHYILFRRKQTPQQRILARALNNLHLFANNRAAYVFITKQDLIETGADNEHTTTIVNNVVEIEGVDMAFFIHESLDGKIRCSFRCKENYRVDKIASEFGGGGHKYASGATIDLPMEKGIAKICAAIEKELAK
ncbi:MAG: bifunctional oligoribonuclease/PAP phosphatase NrnA [Eubacteriales bacterium]|nr:bifunctional oligoribonuclease/PAP phosphatase NrnA [Eubacteriales bacterium]